MQSIQEQTSLFPAKLEHAVIICGRPSHRRVWSPPRVQVASDLHDANRQPDFLQLRNCSSKGSTSNKVVPGPRRKAVLRETQA